MARARKLLLDRATGNTSARLALAGDLVIWATGGVPRRSHVPGLS